MTIRTTLASYHRDSDCLVIRSSLKQHPVLVAAEVAKVLALSGPTKNILEAPSAQLEVANDRDTQPLQSSLARIQRTPPVQRQVKFFYKTFMGYMEVSGLEEGLDDSLATRSTCKRQTLYLNYV